jgi:hypothetical protein
MPYGACPVNQAPRILITIAGYDASGRTLLSLSQRLSGFAAADLKISNIMNPVATTGSGAFYQKSVWEADTAKFLGRLGRGVALVGAGMTIVVAFSEESSAGSAARRSPAQVVARTAVRSAFNIFGGVVGGAAGGAVGFGLTGGLGGEFPGMIVGGAAGAGIMDEAFKFVFGT